VLPQKAATVRREAAAHLEDLPGWADTAVGDLLSELHRLDERIAEYERHVTQMGSEDQRSLALMKLQGIGSTTASAMVSTIGNARDFKNGRQLAAWLGLVPGQYSSGGCQEQARPTQPLGHGARGALRLLEAVIAIAAKNARMAWAVLAKGEDFKLIEA
jgi:transposase